MKKRAKLNNKNSKFVKSLSVAALAGLTFFGASANAQEVIEGHFIDSPTAPANGAAINNPYNETIDNIDASFKNNYAKSIIHNEAEQAIGGTIANGGAIYNIGTVNGGTITEISGNYGEGYSGAQGGAIWNVSNTFKLDEVGDITDNHAIAVVAPVYGGAIYNTAAADFGKLNGAIKNNYVLSGKLDENGKVISGTGSVAYGGAIYNTAGGFTGGNVTEISGNYAESGNAPAYGGAIYNTSNAFKLDEIGDIINNHVYSPYAPAEGGAIYNEKGNLGEINGAIKDNYAISGTYDENGNLVSGAYAYGGAIYNANNGIVTGGTITEISGNYVEGNAGAYGGAIYNTTNSFKLDEVGDITDNHAIAAVAPAYGGAIYNEKGNLGEINGAIKDNYAVSMRYDSNGEPVGGCGAMGGAIYNINNGTVTGGDITEISGNYVEAYGQGNVAGYYPYARGGAIYNTSSNFKLDSISNITDNHAESTHCAYIDGGAIYNENGNLGEINGVIKNNYLINHDQQTVSDMSGGAIYNYDGTATGGNITEISGNYITSYLAYYSFGGAIYNNSAKFKLDGIANIINNHIEQKREGYLGGRQDGGAIYNSRGNLGTINGVIKDNYIIGSVAYGGAIYNYEGTVTGGTITEISGNYIKSYGYAGGGAIYNNSSNFKLDSIGDITNNHIESGNANVGSAASGGAIYNSGGNLGVINGVIKNNYVKNETYQALGGAIYNTSGGFTGGVITEISNNYVEGRNDAYGGAIYNTSSTFKLDGIGDIINNHAGAINPDYYTAVQGGAIYNSGGNLGEINGVIKNNYVLGNSGGQQGSYAYGGAIYNSNNGIVTGGTITEISDNYAKGGFASGGAIYNSATFSANIIGDIVNNYIEGKYGTRGGAIYNSGTFGNIVSENISNNYAKYENAYAQGGAIDNEGNGTIASLYVKNLTDNYIMLSDKTYGAYEYGGAIYNAGTINEGFIENVSDNYIDGRQAHGGAIYNTGAFNAAIGNIVNNYAKSTAAPTYGGAIYNSGTMTTLTGDNLSNNYATSETAPVYGGAIYNSGNNAKIDTISYNKIENNYASGKYNAYGGALYNTGTIDGIVNSSFLNNYAEAKDGTAQGGAIYNTGKIGSLVVNNLTDNYIKAKGAYLYGGAIYNTGTVDSGSINLVKGNYILNTTSGTYNFGGAIYNTGVMNVDISNIIDNKITMSTSDIYAEGKGGAIYNTGTIKSLNGHILYNNIELLENGNSSSGGAGGAIYNSGTVNGGTLGNIIGNYINGSEACRIVGGAIYNYSNKFKIDAINGDIADNHVKGWNGAAGGAIYNNDGAFGDVTGNIYNNYSETVVFSTGSSGGLYSLGGAIYNTGTFGNITGNIYNNHAMDGVGGAGGGAIYNAGTMGNIKGDIAQNYTESNYSGWGPSGTGGAIFNGGTIGDISGNIIGNYTHVHRIENQNPAGYGINGGAIYNTGKIGDITTNAVNNYIKIEEVYAAARTQGGFLHNSSYGTIKNIKGNFVGNYIDASPKEDANPNWSISYGGAISNEGKIERLDAEHFINNHTVSITKDADGNVIGGGSAMGGALYNKGTINGGTIGDIKDNYALGYNGANGGAIYNTSANFKLDAINGDITGNYAAASFTGANPVGGGAIYTAGGEIGEISTNKISNNYAEGYMALGGGAIYNTAKIGNITANEISNNYAKAAGNSSGPGTAGGFLYNSGTTGNIMANVIKSNYVVSPHYDARGGAIHNFGTMGDVKANMIGNYVEATPTTVNPAYASGGALSNTGTMGKVTGTYKDNYVKTENGNPASQASFARGGAVYNSGTIDGIVNSSFLNNYTEAKDGTAQGGAVWTSKDLDITANNGTSVFKDNYTKTDGEKDDNAIYVASADAKLNLKQLNNGNMYMYDNIRGEDGYNVNISGDSTGTYYMFNDIYNGNVTMANTTINTVNNKIHTYDFKSLSVNGNTDFVADVDMANQTMDRFTASAYGNHSGKLNVKDMNFISGSDKNKIEIYFAQKGLKDYVTTSKKEFLTPLYKYGIHYDNRDDAGYFVFTRGAGSSNPSDGFNPAVLTSPVATQAGAQASMTNTLYYAFEHGDTFMNFSAMDRFAKINSNTYALAERQGALSTDFNSNLNLDYVHQNKGVWTKPYSSFESIHLKNGPKVDVISYGTLIGFDSNIHKLKRGWANVATAYIGYNGSQVDYSNVDASTNGGLLGLTETFYKGNFWTALTATAGASFAEAHTMYGKDEMTMLMAGIGSKTGYNFEFKEGKFIIQPRLFMSYSFVNTFDYTNSAGVRIDSDPMHTVQINPSVKFIGNIKGGWQPYASVGMVWNLLNETHTEANGVKLPEMHTKPYVEYGVGLQRTWADKFSAYGQAMLRHGGRNGVALTFGFRWAIGKGVNDKQKVQKDSKMLGRQEVKRASKTLSHQNKTATEGNRKVLKQLSQTQKAYLEHTTHTAMNANVEKL